MEDFELCEKLPLVPKVVSMSYWYGKKNKQATTKCRRFCENREKTTGPLIEYVCAV